MKLQSCYFTAQGCAASYRLVPHIYRLHILAKCFRNQRRIEGRMVDSCCTKDR